jgi:hypothetical protein
MAIAVAPRNGVEVPTRHVSDAPEYHILERTKNIALAVLFVAVAVLATVEYTAGPTNITADSVRTSATAGPRLPL